MNIKTQQINTVRLDEKEVERISEKLGLHKKLVELLMLRGYDNADAIDVFLHPDVGNFYPP